MTEPRRIGLAAAMAGGYVLGRKQKGRMALTAAALLLGRALGSRKHGSEKNGDTGDADRESGTPARNEVVRMGRALVSDAAGRRVTALTDALRRHTLGLDGGPEEDEEPEDRAEDGEDDRSRPSDGGTAKPRARRTAPAKKGAPKKKSPAKKAAPAKKTAARKTSSGKGTASRSSRGSDR